LSRSLARNNTSLPIAGFVQAKRGRKEREEEEGDVEEGEVPDKGDASLAQLSIALQKAAKSEFGSTSSAIWIKRVLGAHTNKEIISPVTKFV